MIDIFRLGIFNSLFVTVTTEKKVKPFVCVIYSEQHYLLLQVSLNARFFWRQQRKAFEDLRPCEDLTFSDQNLQGPGMHIQLPNNSFYHIS